jgi:hypothetical protein
VSFPTAITINGTLRDQAADGIIAARLTPHGKDGLPSFEFVRRGLTLPATDPYNGKTVTVAINATLYFAGDVVEYSDRLDERFGWVRDYRCLGLLNRLSWFPLTDDNTTIDSMRFNLSGEDPDFLGSRAGRTVGQCLITALEGATNSANLIAYGVGNLTSSGTGAAATAVLTAGAVTGFSGLVGGSGWTTAPTVVLVGGSPTTPATVTATVAAGAVTGFSGLTGGAGYKSPPTVLFARLPAATLADLTTGILSTLITPNECDISGEQFGQALTAFLKQWAVNHYLHVEPGGNIRFLDPRAFTNRTITLGSAGSRWGLPALRRSCEQNYSRVIARGQPLTEPIIWSVADGSLLEKFAHDGLTTAQAKTAFRKEDYQQPDSPAGQATATPTIAAAAVSALAVDYPGYGYPASSATIAVTISGGGGSGASYTANSDAAGKITTFNKAAGGSGYTGIPTVTVAPPGPPGNADSGTCTCLSTTQVRLTSANPLIAYAANYWDDTYTGKKGVLYLTYPAGAGLTQKETRRVVANTSKSAGGTADFTLDRALPNTNFTTYTLQGLAAGGSPVWRRHEPADAVQGRAMARRFCHPVPKPNAAGNAESLTTAPSGTILYSATGAAPYREGFMGLTVDPDAVEIWFDRPTIWGLGTPDSPAVPTDVRVFIPINKGSLKATYPADDGYGNPVHAGTFYTVECGSVAARGRTLYVQLDNWRDPSNQLAMNAFAQELHGTVKDTHVEGSITYHGLYEEALTPGNAYAIGAAYTTPWSAINIPNLTTELTWNVGPEGPLYYTKLTLSNKWAWASGAAYLRPAITGGSIMLDVAGTTFLGGAGSNFANGRFDAATGQQLAPMPDASIFDTGNFYGQTGMGAAGAAAGEFAGATGAAFGGFAGAAGSAFGGFQGAGGAAFGQFQGAGEAAADLFHDGIKRGSSAQLADPGAAGFGGGDAAPDMGPGRDAAAEAASNRRRRAEAEKDMFGIGAGKRHGHDAPAAAASDEFDPSRPGG